MSRVVFNTRCQHCGGNVMDDPADERTACLQCGRGIDRITALSYYPNFKKEGSLKDRRNAFIPPNYWVTTHPKQ